MRDEVAYYPYEAVERVPQGRALGVLPSVTCDDDGESEPEYQEAVAIKGVKPTQGFLVPGEGLTTIFAPGPPDGTELSAEVQALLADTIG